MSQFLDKNQIDLHIRYKENAENTDRKEFYNKIMARCGWSQKKLTRILNNTAQPTDAERYVIAEVLQIQVEQLDKLPTV